MIKFACPHCHRDDTLSEYITAPGWQDVDVVLQDGKRAPVRRLPGQREIQTSDAEPDRDGRVWCCRCECDIYLTDLVQLDSDGQPLVVHPPEQGSLV